MNKTKIICIIILTLSYLVVSSQTETLHQMNQYEGTDSVLRVLATEYQLDNNYTFGVWLPIGSCPRCEGAIKLFYNQLKQSFPNEDKVLFFVYPKEQVALDFIKKVDYGFEKMIYLKPNALSQIFHFSSKEAQVPFFFILDNLNGSLIKSVSTLGLDYSETFFKNFTDITNDAYKIKKNETLKNDTPVKSESFSFIKLNVAASDSGVLKVTQSNILNNFNVFFIDESEQKISEIKNFVSSDDGKNLIISDHLSGKILWYSKNDSLFIFQKVIQLDKNIEHCFISNDIPQEVVKYMEKINMLHTMYLDCSLSDDILNISASLPNLFWEDKATEKIGYKNTAVVISGSLSKNLQDVKIVEIKLGENQTQFTHTKIFTSNSSGFYLFPIIKGWPVIGTDASPSTEIENPFKQSFYNEVPALAVFKKTGEFHSSIGQLPLWYQQNLTGYFYFTPIVKHSKPEQAFFCDALIGQIFSIDLKKNETKLLIDIFNLELNNTDTNLNLGSMPLQFIKDKEKYLTNRIEDFLIVENFLYVIVSNKDGFFMAKHNLKSMKIEGDFIIPTNFQGFNISKPKFLNDKGEIKIIGFGINDLDQQVVIIGDTKTTFR